MSKYAHAIEVLHGEINEVGGEVFARWWTDQNEETKKQAEAWDFMSSMFSGTGIAESGDSEAVKKMNALMEAIVMLKRAESADTEPDPSHP